MSEFKTPEHQRGYAQGYAAGRRRADREAAGDTPNDRRERFRQDAFLAILPALLASGTWGSEVDGKHKNWTTMAEFSKGAWNFANEAVKGTWF